VDNLSGVLPRWTDMTRVTHVRGTAPPAVIRLGSCRPEVLPGNAPTRGYDRRKKGVACWATASVLPRTIRRLPCTTRRLSEVLTTCASSNPGEQTRAGTAPAPVRTRSLL